MSFIHFWMKRRWSSVHGFDWNLIRGFLGVLDHGSLSAAARELNVSQPTLTRHISELESVLGVTLFERGREGALPTQAAIGIAASARAMADSAAALGLAAAGKASEVSGTVRITASQVVATYLVPAIVADMLVAMPGLEVELVSSNALDNLLRRDADIALRMTEPSQLDLIARRIGDIPMAVYATRAYLERAGVPDGPADLANHTVIGYDRNDLIIRGLGRAGVDVDRHFFRFRCDDQVATWEAVRAGIGIGFGPRYLGRRDPGLVEIPTEFAIEPLPIWLVTHRELRTSARIRAVFDFLAERLGATDFG